MQLSCGQEEMQRVRRPPSLTTYMLHHSLPPEQERERDRGRCVVSEWQKRQEVVFGDMR